MASLGYHSLRLERGEAVEDSDAFRTNQRALKRIQYRGWKKNASLTKAFLCLATELLYLHCPMLMARFWSSRKGSCLIYCYHLR